VRDGAGARAELQTHLSPRIARLVCRRTDRVRDDDRWVCWRSSRVQNGVSEENPTTTAGGAVPRAGRRGGARSTPNPHPSYMYIFTYIYTFTYVYYNSYTYVYTFTFVYYNSYTHMYTCTYVYTNRRWCGSTCGTARARALNS